MEKIKEQYKKSVKYFFNNKIFIVAIILITILSFGFRFLKRMEPVYAHYPWKWLLKSGAEGVATTDYGRSLMREMMLNYDGNQKRYAQIAGHGYRILAAAMEKNLPYELKCPSLLICGTQDHAGSCIRYNKAWHQKSKIPLKWIEGAGHNSNTDKPELINSLIEEFAAGI